MADTAPRPTLCFNASFPLEVHFAATAGELASRLAQSAGLAEDEAREIGRSVDEAFTSVLNSRGPNGASAIDISLCARHDNFDASVAFGSTSVLAITRPRPL